MAKKGIMIIGAILAISIAGGALFVGWLMGNDWQFSGDPKQITPEIDGIIEKSEWIRANYYNLPFYLDIDNTIDPLESKANVDGWNYLSVGEDEDYYYFAVDLCSDRTNNKDGEWFAFHLANQLPDALSSNLAFWALEDYGYEYLYYNVSGNNIFDYALDYGVGSQSYYDIPIVPQMDTMDVLRGSASGGFDEFQSVADNEIFEVTSIFYEAESIWLAGDFVDIHFGVNITEKLPDEDVSAIMASMTDMDVRIVIESNLTSNPTIHLGDPDLIHFSVAEHGGMPGNISDASFLNNIEEKTFTANSTYYVDSDLDHTTINATDGMFYFTIHAWNDEDAANPTGYEFLIDKISLKFTISEIYSIVGTSLASANYDIAYSYGPSDKCAEDHRMFEFKVAKSEFPALADEVLYLNLAGYGTMLMTGTNYWVYPVYDFPIPPVYYAVDNQFEFITLDMSTA
ncbi:MAG: hypothetical protein ACTSQF_03505 [Candidatus Heimdallarchaeaceae archaeon]